MSRSWPRRSSCSKTANRPSSTSDAPSRSATGSPQQPRVPEFLRDVARSEIRIGDFELIDNGRTADALEQYLKALETSRKIVEIDPVSTIYKGDLAYVLYRVGAAEQRLGKTQPAAEHFAECLKLRKSLASNPTAKITEIDLVLALARCGQHKDAAERMDNVLLIRRPMRPSGSRRPAAMPSATARRSAASRSARWARTCK